MKRKTKITIDSSRCGGVGGAVDPRGCCRCLQVCRPAVFHLHQRFGTVEPDPFDPQSWRVTPLWLSLCTGCRECEAACPVQAIRATPASRVTPAARRLR
jgi:NAD-dependent dihydropyrimidine dehydrogenase PreA subunit